MSPQRYEPVRDDDDEATLLHREKPESIPSSPPPSFRSRTSSPTTRHLLSSPTSLDAEAERTLVDAFDANPEEQDQDDRQRIMRSMTSRDNLEGNTNLNRQSLLVGQQAVTGSEDHSVSSGPQPVNIEGVNLPASSLANDGVFANLSAKPERGEKIEELPPTYEQAAADATPPYWETTIMAPGMGSDEVYVNGLPVGGLFSFMWNCLISMSFQLVGFLLTYLLHTTHAAKNGSRAGLGITLVQYGFSMRSSRMTKKPAYEDPPDPNSHTFDPSTLSDTAAVVDSVASAQSNNGVSSGGILGISSSDWISYILMIVGWFILIRAVSDWFKARHHEKLVLRSPDRGLSVPIVAEGEGAETVA